MNASTAAALSRINERFYARYEEAFSATRSRPWPGWSRALQPFLSQRRRTAESRPDSILDVGCGNGRFGVFLDSADPGPNRYLGLDSSAEILHRARQNLDGSGSLEASFRLQDLIDPDGVLQPGERGFDLVAVFGVLHHLPGLERRRRLLEELAASLAPGGFLIASFWQFAGRSRFRRRIVSWSDHNRASADPVDQAQLEAGDYLLAWGERGDTGERNGEALGARRYCHYADPREAEALIDSLGLTKVDRFESDGGPGDLNLYFTLQAAR